MSIASLKNKISKRIKNDALKTDYQEIGSFIKKKRKDLNLTQDIISHGICSVSYLSKIENNQIVPNEYFVKEIMSKLDVEEDFLSKNLEDKEYLEQVVKYFFYVDDNGLEELFNNIKNIEDNMIINICKFGYYIFNKERMNNEYVIMLENLVMNMNDFELKTYLLFTALYFLSHDDYKTSLEILIMAAKIKVSNDYLEAMVHEYTYYVKQRLLKKNCAIVSFEEAQRIYVKYMNNVRSMRLVLNKIKFLIYEDPSHALELLNTVKTSLLKGFNLEYYYYLKAKVLHLKRCNNETVMALSNISQSSILFMSKMVLLFEICLEEDDSDMLDEIKFMLKEHKATKSDLKEKVYYHYLMQRSQDNKKEYLRDIAIPFAIKTSDYYALKKYVDLIIDICIEGSRYKEATQYYKKYQKEMNRVEKILHK